MPAPVLAAVQGHLELEARIGGYEAADACEAEVGEAYEAVAALLGTRPANVALVRHATEGSGDDDGPQAGFRRYSQRLKVLVVYVESHRKVALPQS